MGNSQKKSYLVGCDFGIAVFPLLPEGVEFRGAILDFALFLWEALLLLPLHQEFEFDLQNNPRVSRVLVLPMDSEPLARISVT